MMLNGVTCWLNMDVKYARQGADIVFCLPRRVPSELMLKMGTLLVRGA